MALDNPADETRRILVVDDDEPLRTAIAKYLTKIGHEVSTAGSGTEALKVLKAEMFAVVLLDLKMPGLSGSDVVQPALEIDPDLAILMLTGFNDAHTASICMQRGAMDYLNKPIELKDLSKAVEGALRKRDTAIQARGISDWVKEELAERTAELEKQHLKQQQITVATLEALINALEAKDPYQIGHSARVAALSATIAAALGLPDDEVERVRTAGRLHDLGKIGIKESVLNKNGPLTDKEFDHVREHVVIGSRILEPLEHLGPIISYVRSHHERFDGDGYPDGKAGEEIPLGGRIICASEVYDALTEERPYQEKYTPEDAADRMGALVGSVLDPKVVEALKTSVENRQALVFVGSTKGPEED